MTETGVLVLRIVAIYISVIGSACSLLLLYLLVKAEIRNDFNRLLFYMTLSQFIFDATISTFAFPQSLFSTIINVISLTSNVCSFMISAMISLSVLHVLYYKAIFDKTRYYFLVRFAIIIPNITFITLLIYGIACEKDYYVLIGRYAATFIRLACILVNFSNFFICKYIVYQLSGYNDANYRQNLTDSMLAITVLVDRLKYYPIFQVRISPFYTFKQRFIFLKTDFFITFFSKSRW
jgi:hypothetical protein